jgi:hypothetical protein
VLAVALANKLARIAWAFTAVDLKNALGQIKACEWAHCFGGDD